ncbi:T9SS type A sorting domain-containing protein [Winogradskyella forsetii]|uniref:T9SS type A sorting domain-containing protein n=1 Tax=Winogradskyella forsetii TaxID=2686077 RepID=UPI0015BE3453|nr:T9SS type A sorting domain-containing protein [Winogradskyella forsetii]
MRKAYLFYVMLSLFALGYSQTIATIDRENGSGPTLTDNVANMSSTGLTRGSGLNLANAANLNSFSSNNFTIGGDLAGAQATNDYIEWSVSANTAFEVAVDELDIRLRRNPNGPENWQIFYSLDGFATAGIDLSGPQTISANITEPFSFSGLGINSGVSGTITFRVYAWGSLANNGNFRVFGQAGWSLSAAVPNPGIRMIGTVTTTSTNSTESDIIASDFPLAPVQENIDYMAYNAPSGLNFTNSVPLGAFTIRDGGASTPDADTDGTNLTSIEFEVVNSENIAALAIFDLGVFDFVAEVTSVSDFTTFNGLNLLAGDNTTRQFVIYATFNSTVTDNEQIQLTINNVTTPATSSSLFAATDAGGAETSINDDDNRIEVTASQFQFNQQPTDSNQGEVMVPYPTISAVDDNFNLDLDADIAGIDVATISGSSSIVGETYNMLNGQAILDKIVFTGQEINRSLVASSVSPSLSGTSTTFSINGPLISIVEQDFDTAIDWTYTSDTPFFGTVLDWGDTLGYFGEIALTDAFPINSSFFSDEILGENDLNDSANPFATITFADVDVTSYTNIKIEFDWQVVGYVNNANDIQYRLVYDGSAAGTGGWQTVFDGNGAISDDQGRVEISIPDGNATVGLQLRLRNNLADGYSGFDNFRLLSEFNGLIYTNADGWKDNIEPDLTTGALDALVVDGTYDVSGDVEINNLISYNGSTIDIGFGESITTNADVLAKGSLEMNSISNSYSSLIVGGTINTKVTYNRHVNQNSGTGSSTGNNDLISAPVTDASQTYLAFRTTNTDIPSGTIDGVPSFLFGPFDNTTNEYINHPASDETTVIEPGIGYRTASTAPSGSTFEFVGDVITGSLAVPITVGAASRANLIGNPYPSYLKLSTFLTANSTQFSPSNSGVYGYVGNVLSGFRIWNQAYSDANPNAKIAPGQGFFVISKDGGGTIDFNPDMRTKGTADDFISGRSANQDLAHVYLQVAKGEELYQTDLYFNDNASLNMDAGYDAEMFEANTPSFAIYSHLVEDNLGKDFAVQSVSYSDLNNVTIPLGINIAQGEQAVISISEMNIPDGTTVILEDNTTNTFTNLLESDYTFTPTTTLNDTGRFYIHFSNETLGLNDETKNSIEISTDVPTKTIIVKGQLESQTKLNLYDIQGRLVISQSINSKNLEQRIDVSSLTAGIYVVELQNNAAINRTQKVIIR